MHLENAGMPNKHGLYELDIVLFGHQWLITTGIVIRRIARKPRMIELIEDKIMTAKHSIRLMENSATTKIDWMLIERQKTKVKQLKRQLAKLKDSSE